jgi:hypothetical protein
MAAKIPKAGKKDAEREVIRRKSAGERRESMIKVLATIEEKEAWKSTATAEGMSVSTWLRQLAIRASKAS